MGRPTARSPGDITHGAVGDKSDNAAVPGHAGDEIADHARSPVASGCHDDDIAGLGRFQGAEHRQIIGRACITSYGNATEGGRIAQRLDLPVQRAAAAHRIHQVAGGGTPQRRYGLGRGALEIAPDSEDGRVGDHLR